MKDFNITMRRDISTIHYFFGCMKNTVRVLESSNQFNFNKDTILNFLESIIQGNPIHVVLVSCRFATIKSRPFMKNYLSDSAAHVYTSDKYPYNGYNYVLDGYQRLQSLYTAYYGYFNDEKIMYDLSVMDSGKRFFFEKKNKSSDSLLKLDKVLSRARRPLISNWLFDAYNDNLHKFSQAFKLSSRVYITFINVERGNVINSKSRADKERFYIQEYQNKLDLFLNMLNDAEACTHFIETGNRLQSFLELVGNSK